MKSVHQFRSLLILTAAGLVSLLQAGCGDGEGIRVYEAPEPNVPEAAATGAATDGADRMLAVMVPKGSRTWFFKLTGPKEAVAAEQETFRKFLESVKLPDSQNGRPEWTLPEGWSERTGTGMRYATITVDADGKSLEMSVIPLPSGGGNPEEYTLRNVNRWRGQLELPTIGLDELAEHTEQLTVDGVTATMVNFVGNLKEGGGMGRAPFAG